MEYDYLADEDGMGMMAGEPEAAAIVNRELELARRIVEQTGANLFLTGKAGTGKTTFLRRLRETFQLPQSGFLQIPPRDGHPCL